MDAHRVLLGSVILAVMIVTLIGSEPSITGFVPTETYAQNLDIDVSSSQRFILRPASGGIMEVGSLAISGSVTGPGLVNVYLSDGQAQWLVFTNKDKRGSSMESITGMYELDIQPGQRLSRIESLPDGYTATSGPFKTQCIETCVLPEDLFNKPYLYLDIVLEPGTSLHVDSIQFSSMS